MGQKEDQKAFHDRLRELGCTVEMSRRSGHYKVRKEGRYIYTLPATAGDWRSLTKAKTQLRRLYGLDV